MYSHCPSRALEGLAELIFLTISSFSSFDVFIGTSAGCGEDWRRGRRRLVLVFTAAFGDAEVESWPLLRRFPLDVARVYGAEDLITYRVGFSE